MAANKRLFVNLVLNSAGFHTNMGLAARDVENFGHNSERAGQQVGFLGNKAQLAGVAIAAAFTIAARQGIEFEKQMRNVGTVMDLSGGKFKAASDDVIALSERLPQSATDLAGGLYQIASSGFQGADGLTVLGQAGAAASAGLTTTATAATVITGVLNAYSEGAGQAKDVSDILFQTVNLGVITFEQLANEVGYFIGQGRALGIPFDQLASAVATLTVNGVAADQVGTTLGATLNSLIKPTTGMKQALHELGFETGSQAVQTLGLRGTLEALAKQSGGTAEGMSKLFGDVQGLRGALLATAGGGEKYNAIAKQIESESGRAGATQRALAEQAKSLAFQLHILANTAMAEILHAYMAISPQAIKFTRALQDAIPKAVDLGKEVGHDLGPLVHALGDDLEAAWHFITAFSSAVGPLARALAEIVGIPIVETLTGIAEAAAKITEFMADHPVLIQALAVAWGAALIPKLILGAQWLLYIARLQIGLWATTAAGGVRSLAAAFTQLGIAELAVRAGVVVALAGVAEVVQQYVSESDKAKANTRSLMQDFDAMDTSHALQQIGAVKDQFFSTLKVVDKYRGVLGTLKGASELLDPIFTPNTGLAANLNAKELQKAFDEMADKELNVLNNAIAIGKQFGVIGDTVVQLAAKNNIDLSKPWADSGKEIQQVQNLLIGMVQESGMSAAALEADAGQDVDAMKRIADAVKQVTDAVAGSFASANDVIAQFKPDDAAKLIQSAQQGVTEAQREYNRVLAEENPDPSTLADARQRLATATSNLADAQRKAKAESDLSTIYKHDIEQSRTFIANIHAAFDRGLDPNFIARLLEKGPAEASPILTRIVSDHSNGLIELVNKSEHTLQRISTQAIRFAQFTATAMNAPLQTQAQLAKDLPRAIDVQTTLFAKGGHASLKALTDALHLKPGDLQRIATEFGITLPRRIQHELDNHPVHVRVVRPAQPGVSRDNQRRAAFATGGLVEGPGGPTDDRIVAFLSNREYVQPERAVSFYGLGFMEAVRTLKFPRFAAGGYVGRHAPAGGVTVVRVVEKPVQYVTRGGDVHVGEVRAHDYHDFVDQMDAAARVRQSMP